MKRDYTFPSLCVYAFAAEKGFAQSLGASIGDFSKGEENDVLDD